MPLVSAVIVLSLGAGINPIHKDEKLDTPESWQWMLENWKRVFAAEYAGAPPEESRGVSSLDQAGHFLWDALERGHRIGVIASDFTREAIFEGLSRRRTFAATHNIVIDFRIGEAFMGEETTVQEAPRLEIKVIGPLGARRIKAPYFSVTCRNTRMRFPPRNFRILCSE